jgi:hypothetical protein
MKLAKGLRDSPSRLKNFSDSELAYLRYVLMHYDELTADEVMPKDEPELSGQIKLMGFCMALGEEIDQEAQRRGMFENSYQIKPE